MTHKPDASQGDRQHQSINNTKRQSDFLSPYLKETPGSSSGHLLAQEARLLDHIIKACIPKKVIINGQHQNVAQKHRQKKAETLDRVSCVVA